MIAPVDVTGIRIETERLWIRPLLETDLADMHEITGNAEVAQRAGFSWCETLEASAERLKTYLADRETVALVLKGSRKLIGTISLQKRPWHLYPIDRQLKGRELGFDLNRDYWGQGLMPEAVKALTEFCFQNLGYDFVTAGHFEGNLQSRRAIEKSGFHFLFEDDREIPKDRTVHICTFIIYNPDKEI